MSDPPGAKNHAKSYSTVQDRRQHNIMHAFHQSPIPVAKSCPKVLLIGEANILHLGRDD
jgi:hypothetical protein